MTRPADPIVDFVSRCVTRRDGAMMILTRRGFSAMASEELPEGAQVVIRDGKAERVRYVGAVAGR